MMHTVADFWLFIRRYDNSKYIKWKILTFVDPVILIIIWYVSHVMDLMI